VSTQADLGAYALLTDGTTIQIRAARPEDFAAVRDLPLAGSIAVTTEDDAAAAAVRSAGPVALKADVTGLVVRRTRAGAVLLDLHGEDEARRGFRSLQETFGDRMTGAVVQPMITGGVEVTISVLEEQMFGPLDRGSAPVP
jgi:ATP-grasp domain